MRDAELWARLGAAPEADGTRFTVWAPAAERVELVVERALPPPTSEEDAHLMGQPLALRAATGGLFTRVVAGLGAGTRYRLRVDGRGPFPDPASRHQPLGVHGPSEVVEPRTFAWSDAAWPGRALEELVLYELHVGTFTREGTFRAAIPRLAALAELGVTALELMPVADFPGARNWGYDGVAPWAPARCYGTPDDLRALVDAAHALGLAVHLDVVHNHLGPDGAYLPAFAPRFLVRDRPTRWGAAVNLDGPDSAGVREFLIRSAIHWVREYHLDGVRLDATAELHDASPRHYLAELAERVKAATPERPVVVIAEDARNLSKLVRPRSEGGYGLDATWSFDFHHQVHRLLTGECGGWYGDYATSFGDLAAIVNRGWLWSGAASKYWGGPRGDDPAGVEPARCVFYLENHDEAGNRPQGERLHQLVDAATFRAGAALLLLAPQTPLLFMGQEWASSSPFLFFTDHASRLGASIAAHRRRELLAIEDFADSETTDPQDPATFARSTLDWDEREREPHVSALRLHRALLALRRAEPALRGRGCAPRVGRRRRYAAAAPRGGERAGGRSGAPRGAWRHGRRRAPARGRRRVRSRIAARVRGPRGATLGGRARHRGRGVRGRPAAHRSDARTRGDVRAPGRRGVPSHVRRALRRVDDVRRGMLRR